MRDKETYTLKSREILANPKLLAGFIDHTLLKPETQSHDIKRICDEALQHSFKAVCVNPDRVRLASEYLKGSKVLIASVVGFPLGAHASEVKVLETELALSFGATEIDMVLNIGQLKERLYKDVAQDIRKVVSAAGSKQNVKVILETGLLTHEEIRVACRICEENAAHFVKTSTGFLGRGASLEDVQIMFESISDKTEIKASGGIRDLKFACELIAAGATRIGTSSGVQLILAQPVTDSY